MNMILIYMYILFSWDFDISFFLSDEQYSLLYTYQFFIIHPSVDRQLDWSHFLAAMINTNSNG